MASNLSSLFTGPSPWAGHTACAESLLHPKGTVMGPHPLRRCDNSMRRGRPVPCHSVWYTLSPRKEKAPALLIFITAIPVIAIVICQVLRASYKPSQRLQKQGEQNIVLAMEDTLTGS